MGNVFDRYYKRYDEWYDKHKFVYLSEMAAIKKVLPREGSGLEIGVGTGRFAEGLFIPFGIDPSKKMLAFAAKRRVNVRVGVGEKLPYPDSSFDYVAIIISLCFVRDPIKVLSEAHRVLKRKGRIIIGIVDRGSFLGKFYKRKKSLFYKEARFFSVNEVIDLLKKTGFNLFSYYQTIFSLPDQIASLQKPKKGFGEGGFAVIAARKRFLGVKSGHCQVTRPNK